MTPAGGGHPHVKAGVVVGGGGAQVLRVSRSISHCICIHLLVRRHPSRRPSISTQMVFQEFLSGLVPFLCPPRRENSHHAHICTSMHLQQTMVSSRLANSGGESHGGVCEKLQCWSTKGGPKQSLRPLGPVRRVIDDVFITRCGAERGMGRLTQLPPL